MALHCTKHSLDGEVDQCIQVQRTSGAEQMLYFLILFSYPAHNYFHGEINSLHFVSGCSSFGGTDGEAVKKKPIDCDEDEISINNNTNNNNNGDGECSGTHVAIGVVVVVIIVIALAVGLGVGLSTNKSSSGSSGGGGGGSQCNDVHCNSYGYYYSTSTGCKVCCDYSPYYCATKGCYSSGENHLLRNIRVRCWLLLQIMLYLIDGIF